MRKEDTWNSIARRTLRRADESILRHRLSSSIGYLADNGERINPNHTQSEPVIPPIGGRLFAAKTGEEFSLSFSYGDDTYIVCRVQGDEIVDDNGALIEGDELQDIEKLLDAIDRKTIDSRRRTVQLSDQHAFRP